MSNRQEFEQYVDSLYSRRARWYKILHSLQTLGVDSFWRKRIACQIMQGEFNRLIEPGTGTGLASAALLRLGFSGEIIGIDSNERMLIRKTSFLRDKRQYKAIVANMMDLPFPDSYFDGGFSVVGLGGVFDVYKAFQELIRVIKPGGVFFAIEMCEPRKTIKKWIHNHLTSKLVWHNWGFKDIEVETLLGKLGLNNYEVHYRSDLGFGSVFELRVAIEK